MSEALNGLIERVTFHNPENGFAVLRVKVKGRDNLVTVVGNTTSVTAGEHDVEVEIQGTGVIAKRRFSVSVPKGKLVVLVVTEPR